ncbi:MAG: diguanylate cyclase [Kastovskya adunca ATA6-11-RM4]|jgi:diguanylate cyclase (GGDEF)-like protein/PAS domain S-box-containing protein|nr:diguanylate cyclase [Kastovskya adunca ATA6-11-RM4]
MRFQYNPYFAILSITVILSATIAFVVWRRRSTPASTTFAWMMIAATGYAAVAALESAAIAIPDKVFWSKLEYVGSGSLMTLFLIFAIQFTRQKEWLKPRKRAWLWVIPIFNMALAATNEWHNLVWTGFSPGSRGSNVLIYHHGLGFFWVMAWVYVYTLTSTLLLAKAALRPSALYRRQSRTVLVGALIPLLGSSAYMLALTPPGLNITPMCFMVTGLFFSASLFRFRLFDLIPVARDTLVESMSDSVFVLDVHNRIVDINPAAKRLIGTTGVCVGQYVDEVLARWPEIVRLCYDNEDFETEILMDWVDPRYVELRISPLRDRLGGLTGRLVVLRDITQRYLAETKLRSANERLQTQLLEIEALQVKLREQAIRDGLTGLFNRRYFEETLPKELARAAQGKYPLAIILMDIDYFKKINDTFGHQGGDRVLKVFGNVLRRHTRFSDMACRYGGEEFVLALPNMPWEQACQCAEQIRLSFQVLGVESGEQEIFATVSVGLAMFPDDGETSDDLLQLADKALYAAKADGRNCLRFSR